MSDGPAVNDPGRVAETLSPPGLSAGGLRGLVVVAGMTTMATEMSAARLLQPFFGASTVVWANVIGLILIYLSVGYWYGGRVADRHPHGRGLGIVTLSAAASIAVVPFAAGPVLRLSLGGIESVEIGTIVGSFIGTLLLFSIPVTLLGMVPPYAVRLALSDVAHSGQVAGSLYALSTVGSILGTFGSVLVTIPLIGTRRTMLAFAMALAALSILGLWRHGRLRLAAIAAVLAMGIAAALPVGLVKAAPGTKVLFEKESHHQFVQVLREKSGRRVLSLNEGWAIHSVYQPGRTDRLTDNVWDRFLLLPALLESESAPKTKMLIIGNAAGSAARIYEKYRPNVDIDGVEIDGVVSEAGYDWFDMPRDNLDVHEADGRPFLRLTDEKWDVILVDAYRQPYIPFYLTTQEFFRTVRSRLTPGGVLAINVGSAPGDNRIQEAVGATMRSVFPSVFRWQAVTYNELIIATDVRTSKRELARRLKASDLADNEDVGEMFGQMARGMHAVAPDPDRVLTDDRAPVEWMTDRMIFGAAESELE